MPESVIDLRLGHRW